MLFCGRGIIGHEHWNAKLLRRVFWSLNLGLVLMIVFDLFPLGLHQLLASMRDGDACARSQEYTSSTIFQTLTWMRGIGVAVFVLGGVLPLIWFMVTRALNRKPAHPASEPYVVPPTVLAVAAEPGADEGTSGEERVGQRQA